jgi:hypothetical protein
MYSSGRSSITPAMASSITTCSATMRMPMSVSRPVVSRPMMANVGTNIEADISVFARQPCPR